MQGHAGGVIIIDVTPLIWLYPGTCFQLLYTLPSCRQLPYLLLH